MTVEELYQFKNDFENQEYTPNPMVGVEQPMLSSHSDLHVFLVLERMGVIDGGDVVCSAEHDQIYLNVSIEKFAERVTPDELIDLFHHGVFFSDDSLSMFR